MKHVALGSSQVSASNIVLGMMRIAEMTDAQIRELVSSALEAGITMFDHADIYGGDHLCERRFGEAVRLTPSEREQIIIQTKCGIRAGWFDFSRQHICEAVDASLTALKTDYIDFLLLHRPDALVEPEEVAEAFDALHSAGKVRHFGVSNHSRGQLELLRRYVRQPLHVNQLQLSVTHAPIIAEGVALNMAHEQAVVRTDGILDYCRLSDTTVQAWSPFQSGDGSGPFVGNKQHWPELNAVLDRLAREYGVNPDAIATAWITRHPANMQVILGTTKVARVRDCAAGSDLPLTREQWYEIFRAAGHIVP